MAKILFRLKQVPTEEADEVRQLLDRHAIDWYETEAGRFQISFPAIWLRDESQEERARALIEEHQAQLLVRMRAEHSQRLESGEAETFLQRLAARPAPAILALLAVLFILYISITPFLSIIKH